jgi:hypothetical protein
MNLDFCNSMATTTGTNNNNHTYLSGKLASNKKKPSNSMLLSSPMTSKKNKKKRRREAMASLYTEDLGAEGIKKSATKLAGSHHHQIQHIANLPQTKDEKRRRKKRMVRTGCFCTTAPPYCSLTKLPSITHRRDLGNQLHPRRTKNHKQ